MTRSRLMNQDVALDAGLGGTVTDVAGTPYTSVGGLRKKERRDPALLSSRFDGVGRMIIVGPAGMVSGAGSLPRTCRTSQLEWDLWFTSIKGALPRAVVRARKPEASPQE